MRKFYFKLFWRDFLKNKGHFLLNVNIPKLAKEDHKGMKICRQAQGKWAEEFDRRQDPRGKDYYWMTGKFVNLDSGPETDIEALKNGYTSIVPVRLDFTDMELKQRLEKDWVGFVD